MMMIKPCIDETTKKKEIGEETKEKKKKVPQIYACFIRPSCTFRCSMVFWTSLLSIRLRIDLFNIHHKV